MRDRSRCVRVTNRSMQFSIEKHLLALAIAFRKELVEVAQHELVPLFGQSAARDGMHAILQKHQLFIEMIDRWAGAVLVFFSSHVQVWWR